MIKIQIRYATTTRVDDDGTSYLMRCLWYSAYSPLRVSDLSVSYDSFNYYRQKWERVDD